MGLAARTLVVVVALAAGGCRPVSIVSQPNLPTVSGEGTRCRNAAGQDQPLVTEWPASEKANLESQIRGGGGVVVSFTGCTMTVLTQCHTRDSYYWVRTTPSSDTIRIANEDQLYAKLPLGAASLSGELKGSGTLTMQTTITGQFQLAVAPGTRPAIEGDCDGATHVVGGLAIGAFQLDAGGTSTATIDGSVNAIGSAGANSSASKSIIRRSGEATACASSTDQAPDGGCASPIQMFLIAVDVPGGPSGSIAMGRMRGPIGGPIEVELTSAEPETSWDVVVDGRSVCTTPCTQRLDPSRTILLREQTSFLSRTSRVQLNGLHNWAALGGVQVRAHSTSSWNLAGLSRLGGFFYGAVGAGFLIPCLRGGEDSDQMCTVSGMTFGFGFGLFALGTWVLDSPGRADTSPLSGRF